ncbi:hypothetical protein JIR23_28545 [Bradyrhizobium diazoefficiens]|nr:hypothetical protein [Bradyrhizobium diazoefficiens]QQN63426.1 hypothetical protein JIR23_28545 [Bradyrhizobium diazoefficiens]
MNEFPIDTRLPLGAIVWRLEKNLSRYRTFPTAADERAIQEKYEDFDRRFRSRPDYKLWRTGVLPHFSVSKPWLHRPRTPFLRDDQHSLAEFGVLCVESDDWVVLWSTIALASSIIRDHYKRGIVFDHSSLWAFADRLYGRLRYELNPLPNCPASCGLAAAFFLLAYQNLYHNSGRSLKQSELDDFFSLLEHWFNVADPDWQPGRKLSLTTVETERAGQHRLRPGHDAYEYSWLANTLGILRPTLSLSITEFSGQAEKLLHKAYQYGLTAWLTARSRRIDQMKHEHQLREFDASRAFRNRRTAFLKELECQWNASNAARDAAEYLEAGKLLYLFYRLVPDEFRDDPLIKKEILRRSGTIRYLKEVGLEPDPRFATNDSISEIREVIDRAATLRWEAWKGGLGVPPDLEPSQEDKWTGFILRVRHEQRTLPDWITLLNASDIPGGKQTPAGYLLTIMKGLADCGFPASPESLSAAYRLALRYGYVRSAGKILTRAVQQNDFLLTPKLLMDFVHAVKRCTQLDPFGVRHERISEWRGLIVDACEKLLQENGVGKWLPARDRVWLHELLLNRTHVHHRTLSIENKRRLFQKAVGTYELDDLREFYDLEYDFQRRAPGIANIETISAFCAEHKDTGLGAPVAISALRLGQFVSVLAVGQDGLTAAEDVVLENFDLSIEDLRADSAHWFMMADIETDEQIQWPNDFRSLCHTFARVAQSCDATAKVIFLACDWFIAQFPWQHLFQTEGFDHLVAIVPNFSAMSLDQRANFESRDLRFVLSTEQEPELREVAGVVRQTVGGSGWRGASVCVIVGHGSKAVDGSLPSVRVGASPDDRVASLDDWMSVLASRIVILHCCHSGVPNPVVMQELGGLAGLATNLGTATILAPVAEVHPSAAKQLQISLSADEGRHELGLQYLQAIKKQPECSLYNLYGDPYESVNGRRIEEAGKYRARSAASG